MHDGPDSTELGNALRGAKAVALSWHGVLFDRDRAAIHRAVAATFARWGVAISDAELRATRGPTGRPQIVRLLSIPRIAEEFRVRKGRWADTSDIEAMGRDLEPRLLAAAGEAPEPNPEACEVLRSLRARGIKTAVICCTPRRLLGPQLEALAQSGAPVDCVVTADEACEPAPAPWGIFDVLQKLGLATASELALVDDSPAGVTAARNAGVFGVALAVEGAPAGSDARAIIRSLDELASR